MRSLAKNHCRLHLANSPAADVLLVPGGAVKNSMENAALLRWSTEERRKHRNMSVSVCTGAFILAKAGLLTA